MIKHLYDIFAKTWFHGGQIYFIGDTHFGDLDCYKRRFKEEWKHSDSKVNFVKNLDQLEIDRINSRVHKNDTLVLLGDVGDINCVAKLKAGYKVLIMGNHDSGASNYKRVKMDAMIDVVAISSSFESTGELVPAKSPCVVDNHLFDEVYEEELYISPKILLSHEPDMEKRSCFNIHGHDHNVSPFGNYTEHLSDGEVVGGDYNCCWESLKGYPISLKEIIESGMTKNVRSIHRETIDKATERKRRREQGGTSFTFEAGDKKLDLKSVDLDAFDFFSHN